MILMRVILAFVGLSLTLIYDLLTALSMPLSAGIIDGTLLGSVLAGMAFFVMHIVSNTILFAVFGPALMRLVQEQMVMHELDLT